MNAFEHMTLCAELGLDLETTMAVVRNQYPFEEIEAAIDRMPRDVLDSWRDTLRLITLPKRGKTF